MYEGGSRSGDDVKSGDFIYAASIVAFVSISSTGKNDAQIPLVDMYPGKVLTLYFVDPKLENIQLNMHRK